MSEVYDDSAVDLDAVVGPETGSARHRSLGASALSEDFLKDDLTITCGTDEEDKMVVSIENLRTGEIRTKQTGITNA